jgi:hypothetical protein
MEGNAMSGDELRVTTADLGDLAAKQDRAAEGIRSAVSLPEGTDTAVRNTHGAIASASAGALVAVLAARRSAGSRMAAISDDLCDKLTEAAKRYERSDESMGVILRSQAQIGQM